MDESELIAQGLFEDRKRVLSEKDIQIATLTAERDEAREALEEREGDMHMRIRAGYDKTVADLWRAKVAEVEAERDEARAVLKEAVDVLDYKKNDHPGWWSNWRARAKAALSPSARRSGGGEKEGRICK